MTRARIGHQAISASAGSGKTYQLAHRYMELLAGGVSPDRIVALTFSRKAAGEIFDSVVRYLCRAASSPDEADRTARMIRQPGTGQGEFRQMLRRLLDSLHRLHISTLDSFTVRVAQTFPLELGVPPNFRLLGEEGMARAVRDRVLAAALSRDAAGARGPHSFRLACRQASFGRELRSLREEMEDIVDTRRDYYQVLPDPAAWGREDRIWTGTPPWWQAAAGPGGASASPEEAAACLLGLLDQEDLPDGVRGRWRAFAEATCRFGISSSWSPPLDYLFPKLVEGLDGMLAGDVRLVTDRRQQKLSAAQCRHALALMAHIVRAEITVALERTRGIYGVLDLYEEAYDAIMRRQGRLTFTDVQYLLTAGNQASGGSVLSRLPSTEARLYIDYRLDCQLDHWLLDEFQDTSDLQWEVLGNLADEILQDDSGRRSFFYVGDTKQAIYGWRGGNARLFSRILERYGESIEVRRLSTSFRSCPAVIDMVNAVFDRIPPGLLPEGALAQWRDSWQRHQCEAGAVPADGYAAVVEPPCEGGSGRPTAGDRYRTLAGLLREIDPLRKGLSVAVLVRRNQSGEEVVDYLRRECPGWHIIHEGRAFIRDNPVLSLLLALVQFAAHPGDTLAWRHLEMSPLSPHFAELALNRDSLPLLLLRQLQSDGFQGLVRAWGARLEAAGALDDFGRKRLGELVNAAIEFDGSGLRDANSFLDFIDTYQTHDLAASGAIRVMTIHQAKGLGFDVVALPDLQDGSMTASARTDFVLGRDPRTEQPGWALEMPRRAVAQSDPVLREQLVRAQETAAFDSLCLLYVAMTRARQGLYLITSFPGRSAEALTPAAFVKQQLTGGSGAVEGRRIHLAGEDAVCLYETGNRHWHRAKGPPVTAPAPRAAPLPAGFSLRPSRRGRLAHVQPSRLPYRAQSAGRLFDPAARDVLDVGTGVHQLFEKVSWIDQTDLEALIAGWSLSSSLREDLKRQAAGIFRQAAAAPEIRSALAQPGGEVELWRERPFEVAAGGKWISGTFDRAVLSRDQAGRLLEATVIDFKSEDASGEAALDNAARHYQPQMEIYRTALSTMLGLPPARVTLKLVFARAGRVRTLGRP